MVEPEVPAVEWAKRQITAARLKAVCKAGQGNATCRYIMAGVHGICCAKKIGGINAHLDQMAEGGKIVARGDNCSGLPLD